MIITHLAHSSFLLELENGLRIVTDPCDASCGYPLTHPRTDAVLVSHHHHDHDAVETLTGDPRVIDTAGEHTLSQDVHVTAVPGWHDDVQGAKRGPNLLFLLEAEGLRVAHLGDIGCSLTKEQLDVLAPVDVLMIPVGGFFTVDAAQAKAIAEMLQAKVILPMHYKTDYNAGWPIAGVDAFLKLYGGEAEYAPQLRVTAGDLVCQPHVAVLSEPGA